MTGNHSKDENQKKDSSVQSIVSSGKDTKCPICLTTITNRAVADTCFHEFCFECINQWSSNHNRCPICRQTYSNIKYNIESNEVFDVLSVEEHPEADEEVIEALLHRMLLYLRLIGLRNRVQRQRDELWQQLSQLEKRVNESLCSRKDKKELKQRIESMRSQIRGMDEDLLRLSATLNTESTEEELNEALNGRENDVQVMDMFDILLDPDQIIESLADNSNHEVAEDESSESIPSLVSDDSGNESDDEEEPEEEVVNNRRGRRRTRNNNTDSNDSGQPSAKRTKRQ